MKKALLVSGLFSLVMVLTSFTSREIAENANSNDNKVEILEGGSALGGNKKVDLTESSALEGNKNGD